MLFYDSPHASKVSIIKWLYFKLSPSGAFCWSWQEPSNGYLVILDPSLAMRGAPLSAGKTFRSVNDHHFSYHSDGTRHRTVKAGAIKAAQHLGRQKTIALANIREWSSVRSVSVPLKGRSARRSAPECGVPFNALAKPQSAQRNLLNDLNAKTAEVRVHACTTHCQRPKSFKQSGTGV